MRYDISVASFAWSFNVRQPDTPKTVLVIGGGVEIRDALCLALSREGCLIRVTGNERSALSLVNENAPDIVILDPVVSENGINDFHKSLLERNPLSRLVLVVPPNEDCKRSEWRTVKHFLKAPISRAKLLAAAGLQPNGRQHIIWRPESP